MTAVLVDSNVILDIATEDDVWCDWSSEALEKAANGSALVINPIIYAEISIAYSRIEDLEGVVPPQAFRREALSYEAGFLAGKAFLTYRRRGGTRRSPLPDFYVGAHAAIAGYRLLTRDDNRYRSYFPSVQLIAPRRSRS